MHCRNFLPRNSLIGAAALRPTRAPLNAHQINVLEAVHRGDPHALCMQGWARGEALLQPADYLRRGALSSFERFGLKVSP